MAWYLLSYDIRDDRRLKRFHYRLSKQALPLQKSVFLVRGDAKKLKSIEKLVKRYTQTQEDDVRLYPISHPNSIWSAGQQHQAFADIYGGGQNTSPETESAFKRFLRKILGRAS